MSSWASIELGGQRVLDMRNHLNEWYFRKSERRIVPDPAEGFHRYEYATSAATIRRRLELDGHTLASLKREFANQFERMKSDMRELVEIEPEGKDAVLLSVLEQSTFDDWIHRLKRIVERKLEATYFEEPKSYEDPLVTFMLDGRATLYSGDATAGPYRFPCETSEGWAVALLQVLPDDAECVLDASNLVSSGWTDEFDDLEQFQADTTVFFSHFKASLAETRDMTKIMPGTLALPRMLYASVITAMETYLADTLRKQILTKPAVKRRFVETHKFAEKTSFPIGDIYKQLEILDEKIANEIDRLSFHHLPTVVTLYKNVLLTELAPAHASRLGAAVQIRHDIVHRNGRTVKGSQHTILMADVLQLADDIEGAMLDVDNQIKDGLLDDVDEKLPGL